MGPSELVALDSLTGEVKFVFRREKTLLSYKTFSVCGSTLVLGVRSYESAPVGWDSDPHHDEVLILDAQTGESQRSISTPDAAECLAYEPQFDQIVTGHDGGAIRIWNPSAGALLKEFYTEKTSISEIRFAHHGESIVGCGHLDTSITVWNAKTGRTRFALIGPGDPVRDLDICKDGSRIACISNDASAATLRIWPLPSLESLAIEHQTPVTSIAVNGDASLIATGTQDGTITIWNAVLCQAVAHH